MKFFLHQSTKFFVIEKLTVTNFEAKILSYTVINSGILGVVRQTSLLAAWPLSMHCHSGKFNVMNLYGHLSELII
jgi:hypothetical protein